MCEEGGNLLKNNINLKTMHFKFNLNKAVAIIEFINIYLNLFIF